MSKTFKIPTINASFDLLQTVEQVNCGRALKLFNDTIRRGWPMKLYITNKRIVIDSGWLDQSSLIFEDLK
jgi:hypothetical protein